LSEESAVVDYGREFFRTHKVSQATFDAAQSQFGVRGLVELNNLMGYHSSLAFNINAFDVGLPSRLTEPPLGVYLFFFRGGLEAARFLGKALE